MSRSVTPPGEETFSRCAGSGGNGLGWDGMSWIDGSIEVQRGVGYVTATDAAIASGPAVRVRV